MRSRRFPILSEAEEDLRTALGTGLGIDASEVLVYLLRRRELTDITPDAATRLEIQIGTGLGRDATIQATNELESSDFVRSTSVQKTHTDQERKAWIPTDDRASTIGAVRDVHATDLLDSSRAIADTFEQELRSGDEKGTDEQTGSLSLALNWEPNDVHAPILHACEAGTYQDRNVVVTIDGKQGSGRAIQSLQDGHSDVCVAGPATVTRNLDSGEDIVPIALLYQRSTVVLYTIRDQFGESFETLEQLRGKGIAMIPGSETGTIARLFLSQADMLSNLTVIRMDNEERSQLLSGGADVAAGMITDPLHLEDAGYQVDSIPIGQQFPIPGLAIVTRPAILESKRDELAALLAGTMDGWHAAQQNPTLAAESIQSLIDEPNARVIEHLIEAFGVTDTTRQHGWGWQTPTQWTRIHSAMQQAGMLEEQR